MDIQKIEDFVTHIFIENLDKNYTFHTLNSAKAIVEKTIEILDKQENAAHKEHTLIAAWFLYSGFTKDYKNHVINSQEIAENFLKEHGATEVEISKISSLIAGAWGNQKPEIREIEVLKDALSAYYGSENLIEKIELQRLEVVHFKNKNISPSKFRKKFVKKLTNKHQYYTEYAIKNWSKKKEENILSLIGKSLKSKKTEKKEALKVKLKNKSPERAIQSLYRIQLRNHLKLSDIADTKANILLSVNAIIISLLLANLIPKLGSPKYSYLIYPTVIFIIFSIASIIMSVLATRPKIENENLLENELTNENKNFLFFGNFHSLTLPEFKGKIDTIIKNKDSIYNSLTMDLYYLGIVLKKKYTLLSRTYTVFIIGIVLSVLAFAIALKYYGMDKELIEAVTTQ